MKTTLAWFSGTGNSLWLAIELAKRIGGARLVPIAWAVRQDEIDLTQQVGLVLPCYMFGPPKILTRFTTMLQAAQDTNFFALVSAAGTPGATFTLLERQLRAKEMHLSGSYFCKMPSNYTPFDRVLKTDAQRQDRRKANADLIAAAQPALDQIAADLSSGAPVHRHGLSSFTAFFGGLVYRMLSGRIPRMDRKFHTTERCTRCGRCASLCPVADIRIGIKGPEWQEHCQQCYACLQYCPVSAIEYRRSTAGKPRYHHPEISHQMLREYLCGPKDVR